MADNPVNPVCLHVADPSGHWIPATADATGAIGGGGSSVSGTLKNREFSFTAATTPQDAFFEPGSGPTEGYLQVEVSGTTLPTDVEVSVTFNAASDAARDVALNQASSSTTNLNRIRAAIVKGTRVDLWPAEFRFLSFEVPLERLSVTCNVLTGGTAPVVTVRFVGV